MAHEKLLWHTEGPGCDYADYRGLRLRKKTICPKGGGLAIRKVFVGFTGVGVVIRSLSVPGHTGRAHKIEAGKHPGDWFKPQTDTYPSINAAIDAFVDMVLNHQDESVKAAKINPPEMTSRYLETCFILGNELKETAR